METQKFPNIFLAFFICLSVSLDFLFPTTRAILTGFYKPTTKVCKAFHHLLTPHFSTAASALSQTPVPAINRSTVLCVFYTYKFSSCLIKDPPNDVCNSYFSYHLGISIPRANYSCALPFVHLLRWMPGTKRE